ncbi:M3 family oligoendopeptidase [Cesiribacter andamanensis]|uniref:Oligoendopeptidase F, plasmid n=1 Tax=Cesiribacter andamanensis AMV16 TaxID=1279009 RepID=M7NBB3_9BACT|nr:M3 family oligoendopeptidase [Cesiribacter andamanensis]EMR04567.1 Oligoendopeptidase F, plasmid [Cesiribacter andamanensis AMV16]
MDQKQLDIPKRSKRRFLPEDFTITDWEGIRPFYEALQQREIHNERELQEWFRDRSELESVLAEELGWRYIRMTINTADAGHRERFNHFISQIQPNIAPEANRLNEKVLECRFLEQLKEGGYPILARTLKTEFEIFREENVPLNTQMNTLQQEFGVISGAMTVEVDGQELTLQQAADHLQSTDRSKREEVWKKISARRLEDGKKLNDLFDQLLQLRHQIALNAGFANYRDFMFKALGRFDYSPEDCEDFHESVSMEVTPLLNELSRQRKEALGVAELRPWDKAVDVEGRQPLKPFSSPHDLMEKTIRVFSRLDPFLGRCLEIMREMEHLDLDSRKGKAPGGYNYPLAETGVPFIFMNATSTLRDMITMLHEGGHAVHSFLTKDLELNDFKHTPSEVAELASMSMELLSMDHWDEFFKDPDELRRAKREHLEQIISTLPWVATIDKFQHWVYTHPQQREEERRAAWEEIYEEFADELTDWSGLEEFKAHMWQKQLHLYEVPFYYIEYGIAQLGAIAVWKNYKENPRKGLDGYLNALKLGYTRPIPEVYAAAHIRFDFSLAYIRELMQFVRAEMEKI